MPCVWQLKEPRAQCLMQGGLNSNGCNTMACCLDAAATKLAKDTMWDATHEGAMPCAWIRSHGCNAMTQCCTKKG